ncbi:MAG TPA: rhomboid family intramembrane serine protease [Bacteroidia bacterium]|nr:rhomboid family intramembrane serine protease [Bacteroidia bacterium]
MTLIIIIITALVSIIAFQKHDIMYKYQFNPYFVKNNNEWIRFFSHALLHADWMHLIFNMLVLYFFGSVVESYFDLYFGDKGILYFLLLYIGGIIFAVLPTYRKHQNDIYYNSVGASGAVSAVLFSSVLLDPVRDLCLYGVLCFPGIIWALIYLGYSFYMGRRGKDNINHDAHFWGAIFGIVFTIAIRPSFAVEFLDKIANFI